MGIWAKITGTSDSPATGRTPKERRRREREIRAIDASTSRWLRSGGHSTNPPRR
jgi:hypothetical protein